MAIDDELRASVRKLFHAEHYSIHGIGKALGIHHETVRRALGMNVTKSPKKPREKTSILKPFQDVIEEHLRLYPKLGATRLIQILRDRGYQGSISTLRNELKRARPQHLKSFMKMVVRPGEQGQVDWAHVGTLKVGRADRKLYLFVMVLSYSRAIFAKFCLNQETSTFLRCHEQAFAYFGGLPRIILYDNLKSVVLARRGFQVRFNPEILDFTGHYCFEPRPCNVRRGNEKGRVERTIRYLRDNYLAARPLTDLKSMNESLLTWCNNIGNQRPWPDDRSLRVKDIWSGERAKLLPLPATPRHPVVQEVRRATKSLWIYFDLNTYSIPAECLGKPLVLEADCDTVKLSSDGKLVAHHVRSYSRGQFVEAKEHRAEVEKHRHFGRTNFFREQIVRDVVGADKILEYLFDRGFDPGTSVKQLLVLSRSYGELLFQAAVTKAVEQNTLSIDGLRLILTKLEAGSEAPPEVAVQLPNNPKVRDLEIRSHSLSHYDTLF